MMQSRVTLVTSDLELVATVFLPPPGRPFQLRRLIRRQGDRATVSW
jgi:hypothetical protein